MRALLLAASLLVTTAASAQISLEKKYGAAMDPFRLSTGDVKFVGYFESVNQVRVYNADHSVLRQVTLPTSSLAPQVDYVDFLSDRLFNTNTNDLEFVVFDYSTGYARLRVFSETGGVLLQVDSCSYAQVVNTSLGSKLVASVQRPVGQYTKVFALPGAYTPLRTATAAADVLGTPYPNPAAERISLPYRVAPGQTASLEVLDTTGRVVRQFTVDATFDHLLLRAAELRAGTYTYRVSSAAGVTAGKKFVVSR